MTENIYRGKAQRWLESLRGGTIRYERFLGYLLEELRKGNLSLADIGTSEDELEALRIKGCKTSAKRWLNELRGSASHFDVLFDRVQTELRKGNLSLADIGTSEDELEALRIKGCKLFAKRWLDYMNRNRENPNLDTILGHVRTELAKCNLSLADIGTSEAEIEELRGQRGDISSMSE